MQQTTYTALCFQLPQFTQGEEKDTDIRWLPMIPAGEAIGRDKRTWFNNNPDAVVAAFDSKIPFDIEHATEIKGPKGEDADAVGWIVKLENREGEIWAGVEWNESGIWRIKDKRYSFYSPAFSYDSQGNIIAMSSAGLTNKPNFIVPALNRLTTNKDNEMKTLPIALCQALAIADTATESDAVVAIEALKNAVTIALNRVKTPDLNNFVPMETHTVALNRAQTAEAVLKTIEDKEVEGLVDAAIAEGKVAPANKDMYVALCRSESGREQFESFAKNAATIVDDKQIKKPAQPAGKTTLEPHEVAMCRKMQINEADFIKSKANFNK